MTEPRNSIVLRWRVMNGGYSYAPFFNPGCSGPRFKAKARWASFLKDLAACFLPMLFTAANAQEDIVCK